jgi:hypothetical protein
MPRRKTNAAKRTATVRDARTKAAARQRHLQRYYGITEEQYDTLLQRQNGACAVCQRSAKEFTKRLAVDHNHRTGEIRGILCYVCNNKVIGRVNDPEIFARASDYLRVGTGWFVPEKRPKRRRRKRVTARKRG